MAAPVPHLLNDPDVLFFYEHAIRLFADVKNRKSIQKLALHHGITIIFEPDVCKSYATTQDTIHIFDNSGGKNQIFFRHLRNAFAHQNIEISGARCRLYDWNLYKNGKPQKLSAAQITMKGDVVYSAFQKLLQEFFTPANKKTAKT